MTGLIANERLDNIVIPRADSKVSGDNFEVLVGFDVSPQQAAFNRLGKRAIMQRIEHPTTGELTVPAWPVRFDGKPPRVKPSPLLGQHNAEIFSEWLGIGASEVDALRAEGII